MSISYESAHKDITRRRWRKRNVMTHYPEKRLSRPSTGFDLERIADTRPEPAEELDAKLSLLLIGMMLDGDALTLYRVALRMAAGEGLNPERYTTRQLRAIHYRLCLREGVTRWRYYAAMPEAAKAVGSVLGGIERPLEGAL